MSRPRGTRLYPIILFLAVWTTWYFLSHAVNADGSAHLLGLFPALVVWYLLDRHTRSTLLVLGLFVGVFGSAAACIAGWMYLRDSYVPHYGAVLAFPIGMLWTWVVGQLLHVVERHRPESWRNGPPDAAGWSAGS